MSYNENDQNSCNSKNLDESKNENLDNLNKSNIFYNKNITIYDSFTKITNKNIDKNDNLYKENNNEIKPNNDLSLTYLYDKQIKEEENYSNNEKTKKDDYIKNNENNKIVSNSLTNSELNINENIKNENNNDFNIDTKDNFNDNNINLIVEENLYNKKEIFENEINNKYSEKNNVIENNYLKDKNFIKNDNKNFSKKFLDDIENFKENESLNINENNNQMIIEDNIIDIKTNGNNFFQNNNKKKDIMILENDLEVNSEEINSNKSIKIENYKKSNNFEEEKNENIKFEEEEINNNINTNIINFNNKFIKELKKINEIKYTNFVIKIIENNLIKEQIDLINKIKELNNIKDIKDINYEIKIIVNKNEIEFINKNNENNSNNKNNLDIFNNLIENNSNEMIIENDTEEIDTNFLINKNINLDKKLINYENEDNSFKKDPKDMIIVNEKKEKDIDNKIDKKLQEEHSNNLIENKIKETVLDKLFEKDIKEIISNDTNNIQNPEEIYNKINEDNINNNLKNVLRDENLKENIKNDMEKINIEYNLKEIKEEKIEFENELKENDNKIRLENDNINSLNSENKIESEDKIEYNKKNKNDLNRDILANEEKELGNTLISKIMDPNLKVKNNKLESEIEKNKIIEENFDEIKILNKSKTNDLIKNKIKMIEEIENTNFENYKQLISNFGLLNNLHINSLNKNDFISENPLPVYLNKDLKNKINFLDNGEFHSLILNDKGKLFTYGNNESGCLGRKIENNNNWYPCLVNLYYEKRNLLINMISAGSYHSLVGDTNKGRLFFCGNFKDNNSFIMDNINEFIEINFDPSKKLNYFGSGSNFCIVKLNNSIYSFGCNNYGQLGTGLDEENDENILNQEDVIKLNYIKGLNKKPISKVFPIYLGCFVISKNNDDIFCWGDNSKCQLGFGIENENEIGDEYIVDIPVRLKNEVTLPFNVDSIADIKGGINHTLFLLKSGFVYGIGLNNFGQLGIDKEKLTELTEISSLKKITEIYCNKYSSYAKDEKGNYYSFGKGENFILGNNEETNTNIPNKIPKKIYYKEKKPFALSMGLNFISLVSGNNYKEIEKKIQSRKTNKLIKRKINK